ncbi:MAG: hypothetical protein IKO47_12070 [Ruminococcus sp.]|nr:hypothetical protein [Ruminococcus sp.]
MKRILAFTASLMLCLSSFTACSDEDESSETDGIASVSAENTSEGTSEETTEPKGIKLPKSMDDTEENTEEETQPNAAKGTSFTHGTIDSDNVYTSEFAGFRFRTPDGWTLLTRKQLLAMMDAGLEYTGNEDSLDEELLEQAAIFDYSARDESGANITMVFENLEISTGSKLANTLTAKDYLEALMSQLNSVQNIKYSNISETDEVELGGQTFLRRSFTADYGTYKVNQYYYVRKVEGLMMYIIVTSGKDREDMTVYEANFLPLD